MSISATSPSVLSGGASKYGAEPLALRHPFRIVAEQSNCSASGGAAGSALTSIVASV